MKDYLKRLGYDLNFIHIDTGELEKKIERLKNSYGILLVTGLEHIQKTTFLLYSLLEGDKRSSILKIPSTEVSQYLEDYGVDSGTLKHVKIVVVDQIISDQIDIRGLLKVIDLIISHEKLLILSSPYPLKSLLRLWDPSLTATLVSYLIMEV